MFELCRRHGFNRAYAFNARQPGKTHLCGLVKLRRDRHGSKLGRGVYFAEDPAGAAIPDSR